MTATIISYNVINFNKIIENDGYLKKKKIENDGPKYLFAFC